MPAEASADSSLSVSELRLRVEELEARLRSEREEAQHREAAVSDLLQAINASAGNLAPVFDVLLEKSMHLCGAAFGILRFWDGSHFHGAASRGVPAAYAEFVAHNPQQPQPGSIGFRIISGEPLVHVLDVANEAIDFSRDPHRHALVDLGGARTSLVVALTRDRRILGAIQLYRQHVQAFSDKQIALLQNFAAQAVIAMENARLLTETRDALEQQTATADILRVISQSPTDVQPVLNVVAEAAQRFCGAEDVTIGLREGDSWIAAAHLGPMQAGVGEPFPVNRQSVMGRSIIGAETVQVSDIDTVSESEFATAVQLARRFGWRAAAAAPLMREGGAAGAILLRRPEAGAFTPRQIELLETFAAQAVIAIENVRLFTETREALERQTATSQVLQVINSSPGDLAPVFDAMLEKAMRLCGAAFGILWIFDGEFVHAAAIRGATPAYAEFLTSRPHRPGVDNAHGRLLRGEEFVHIADVAADTADRSEDPVRRATIELGGTRTLLAVPLRKESAVLGFFVIYRREVRLFGEKQISLLQNFAAQAVIAIENARLITETREALEQQTATTEVVEVINSSPGQLEPVFDAMLEKAMHLCEADFGTFAQYDGKFIHGVAYRGVSGEFIEASRRPFQPSPGGPFEQSLQTGSVLQVPDLADTDAYRSGYFGVTVLVDTGGARTAVWVPLRKEDRSLGALVMYRKEVRLFSDKQVTLLQNFAAQAVIAMENARLLTETREALEQQTATTEVLETINSSPGDLKPVFEVMLAKAMTLCEAAFGTLNTFDGQRLTTAATRGVPEAFARYRLSNPPEYGPGTGPARLVAGEDIVHEIDAADSEAYRQGDSRRRAIVELGGARTILNVALRKDDVLLGTLSIYRQEVRLFSDKQIKLLQNFAAQAVVAMENARLLGELRQRTDELTESLKYQTATSDVLKVISGSTFVLQKVLDTLVESAVVLCEADIGTIRRREGEVYMLAATFGFTQEARSRTEGYSPLPSRSSIFGQAVLEGRTIHIPDILADPDYARPDLQRLTGFRAALGVLLRREGNLIGTLVLQRFAPGPYTPRQIELVETFADQAVIAMENARLLGELRQRTNDLQESFEYQGASSAVLNVISRSPTDAQPVFMAIAESAARLCQAEYCHVFRYDGELIHFMASHGQSLEARESISRLYPKPPGRGSCAARAILNGAVEQVSDVRADPEYTHGEVAEVMKVNSIVAVPMLKDGRPVGAISLLRAASGEFPPRQVELLQTFADQAVIAINNVGLFDEVQARARDLQEALEQQTATAEVLQVISQSPTDVAPVLQAVGAAARRFCGAEDASIFLRDGEEIVAAAHSGSIPALSIGDRDPLGPSTIRGQAIIEGRTVQISDTEALDPDQYTLTRAYARQYNFRAAIAAPMLRDGRAIGCIAMRKPEPGPFTARQIALLESFAAQAVIAIENVRLFTELRESLDQQTATSNVLKTISRSSVDLGAVLETLVETVARLCHADQAYMFRRDDELYHLVASRGLSDEARAFVETHPIAPGDRGTLNGRVSLDRRTVHIVDVLLDADYSYSGQKVAGFRTLLGIPLLRGEALIGIFNVGRTRVDPFTDKEIELATSFADQAVIAIENARLLEELRDRQAELRVTFDNMGDGVARFEGDQRLAAWNRNFQEIMGLSDEWLARRPTYAEYLRLLADRGEFGAENVESALSALLVDTDKEVRRERTLADGTVIEVRRNAVPGGGFVLIYSDVTEQRRAEAAIRAARDAAEEALEQQTATAEILRAISQSPTDVQPVLDAVAKAAVRFCGAPDAVVILREGDEAVVAAHEGILTASVGLRRPFVAIGNLGSTAMQEGRTFQVADVASLDPAVHAPTLAFARQHKWRASATAPMMREGEAIGCIVLRKPEPGLLLPRQVVLLETFAAQAIIAIENVRLFTELRDSLERLKAAQANLIQAEKMASLGQLTAGIAHEIKNPLNFVNNFAGLSSELMDELKQVVDALLAEPDEEKRAELQDTMDLLTSNLAKIVEHGRRADGIVKSMLSHSRGGKGDWQESNINALVEEALNLAYHGARAQDRDFNVTLERDFAPEAKPIEVVPQDVTRVFLNLFGNGFYASRKRHLGGADAGYRPTLRVSTRDLGEAVEVTVRDNGTGIQPEVRAKLFQPFFTTKPTGEGTGLGLSISYDIVTQQHGGTIEVESEPGSFTEFTVRLPRRRRAAGSGGA